MMELGHLTWLSAKMAVRSPTSVKMEAVTCCMKKPQFLSHKDLKFNNKRELEACFALWLNSMPQASVGSKRLEFLGTPGDCQELTGQLLRFGEMVMLNRMGETYQLKLVVCKEIMLRHMERMVVV